jgi:hypothetical protein
VDGSSITFPVELQPRERWELRIDVVPVLDGDVLVPTMIERRFGEETWARSRLARRVAAARPATARRMVELEPLVRPVGCRSRGPAHAQLGVQLS